MSFLSELFLASPKYRCSVSSEEWERRMNPKGPSYSDDRFYAILIFPFYHLSLWHLPF